MRGIWEMLDGSLPPPSPRRCATLRFRPPLLPLPPSPLRHFVPPRLRPPLLRHPNTKIIKRSKSHYYLQVLPPPSLRHSVPPRLRPPLAQYKNNKAVLPLQSKIIKRSKSHYYLLLPTPIRAAKRECPRSGVVVHFRGPTTQRLGHEFNIQVYAS